MDIRSEYRKAAAESTSDRIVREQRRAARTAWNGCRFASLASFRERLARKSQDEKNASVRISMLSRAGALAGLVGSSKAACADQRERPSLMES